MADTTQVLFRSDVLQLTRSLTIKFAATATAQNKYYLAFRGVDYSELPLSQQPYYKHLAGQYLDGVDEIMTVTSLDTLEEIPFTYDSLLIHRATAKAYTIDSDYHRALVSRYPDHENLIRGIINPVPIDRAVAADDFSILAWDTSLVEEQETNLLSELQKFINGYVVKWYMPRWGLTQTMYDAAFFAGLMQQIAAAIINIRLRNCGTKYVHSYHIWALLGSHGRLHHYRDYLTTKQALHLYRNITWYENNAGKKETFGELIQHMLTERNIPLAEFQLWHNTESIPSTVYPTPEIAKVPLNDLAVDVLGIRKTTIANVLREQVPMARDNSDYLPSQLSSAPLRARSTFVSKLSSKVVKSEMVDNTDATPIKLVDTIYNEWLYLVTTDRYIANVSLENPLTQTVMTLSARQALVLWTYFLLKEYELPTEVIPTVLITGVMRTTPPAYTELVNNTDMSMITPTMILLAREEHTPISTIVSTEEFYRTAVQIHGNRLAHRILFSTQEDPVRRGYLEQLTQQFYFDTRVAIQDDPTKTYDQWLVENQLDFSDFSTADFAAIEETLFSLVTGMDLKHVNSLKEIQAAMLGIVSQLSSASIQFLKEINEGPYLVPDRLAMRFGIEGEVASGHLYMDNSVRFFEETNERTAMRVDIPLANAPIISNVGVNSTLRVEMGPKTGLRMNPMSVTSLKLYRPGMRFSMVLDPTIPDVMERSRLTGLKTFKASWTEPSFDLPNTRLTGLQLIKVTDPGDDA
jgi:hypothetical protein